MTFITSLSARSSAAMVLTLGLTTANLLPLATLNASAQSKPITIAQSYNNRPVLFNRTIRIAAGAVIPTSYPKAQKIVLAPDERLATTLTIPNNIRSGDGRLLIPAGSTVEGEFRPTTMTNRDGKEEKGTKFYARTLYLTNGSSMALDASSDIVTRKETISKGLNTTSILTGAAIGAGAGTLIAGVTGDRKIGFGNILIGTAAGALGGWLANGQKKADVIVVNPESDLGLRLATPLAFNNAY
jgi:hypothetical protein